MFTSPRRTAGPATPALARPRLHRSTQRIALGAAAALTLALGPATTSHATPTSSVSVTLSSGAQRFVDLINADRARLGVTQLQVDPALVDAAAAWSSTLAATGTDQASHSPSLRSVPGSWSRLGENVGVATDNVGDVVATLHSAFMASPGHYRNIANPDYDRVGIGIAMFNGRTYVTERFGDVRAPSEPAPRVRVRRS